MSVKLRNKKEPGLSDLLNYAHFIEEGILLNKDGAFLMSFQCRGADLYSANPAEIEAMTHTFNRMVTFLDDGWMLHLDELRIPSMDYPAVNYFPDPVSKLIDDDRKRHYEAVGKHYENLQCLTFVWKFPLPVIKTAKHWFVENVDRAPNPSSEKTKDNKENSDINLTVLLQQFQQTIERCTGLLSPFFQLTKLSSQDMLSFLNTCITGDLLPVALPPDGCFIDVVLGRKSVLGGFAPKIGNRHLKALSILGYLNDETVAGLLSELTTYPLIYRWSNRFIPLSASTAEREIKRYQKNWHNQVKGFSGILKEAVFGRPSTQTNYDALTMKAQTDEALTLNRNQSTRFGYWTSTLIFFHDDPSVLKEVISILMRYLEQAGFTAINEELNALEAWLGTIPGHGSYNVRRLFITSQTLAQVLPLHSIWTGAQTSHPASLLPPHSPPVFYASTTGQTPFRYHLDVSDVGHQVILGPTGSGKSTFLGFLIAQFLRYENAQIFVFDKDHSHQALTLALGGQHYDIGSTDSLSFCPLANLSTDAQKLRACQWIEELLECQRVLITPPIRSAIHQAMDILSNETQTHHSRNLTIFQSLVQHEDVRKALQFYTLSGQVKILDGTTNSLPTNYLQTYEMNQLLNQRPEVYLPILSYLFNTIEERLEHSEAKRPTLIILEEAWAYLAHELFAKKLKDWLKTLRKKNARVIFATQSLADLYDPTTQSLTTTTAAILESCPTKVFLPNPAMESEMKTLYQKMGLIDRQIDIISKIGVPKKHYYVVTPEGNRLIELGFESNSLPLSFIGLSKQKNIELIACQKQYKTQWLINWLKH